MSKFRKKPVVVEAVRWNGSNITDIQGFAGPDISWSPIAEAAFIPTLEGLMRADKGDWIIKGVIAAAPIGYELAEAVIAQADGIDRSAYILTRAIEFMKVARGGGGQVFSQKNVTEESGGGVR